jgi:hypothetical protein
VEEKIKEKKGLQIHLNNFKKEFEIIDSKLKDEKIFLNEFYLKDNGVMIAKIWNILYFIEDKNLLGNIKNILNIIESKNLDIIEKLFDIINFNEIELYISFTRKIVNFCKRNSMLWKIILGQNLFEKKESIEEEMK